MSEPSELKVSTFKKNDKVEGFMASRYNVRSEDKHGDLLLLNTYSKKFIRIESEDKEMLNEILRSPNEANQQHMLFKLLIEMGFIIPKSSSEFRKADLRHLETIAQSDELRLILMPNEDCNFRCKYCYESFAKNFMKESVQNGIIQYIKKNIKNYKSIKVDWFGGEPLTAIPIIERLSKAIIEICHRHGVRYSSAMTTNGYNLSLEVFKKMAASRISLYQITLDGLAETHNKTRVRADGSDTFNTIVSNLKDIRDNIKSSTFNIVIRSNLSKPILQSMDQYIDFVSEEFASDPRFSFYWHTQGDWGGASVKQVENTFCTDKDYLPHLRSASEKGMKFPAFEQHLFDSVCYASKLNNFVIGSDGIIYKCTVAFEEEENQIGIITEDGQMHIDNNKLALWVTGHETSDPGCQKCFFRPSCQGASCPLYRMKTGQRPCPPIKYHIKSYMQSIAINSKNVKQLTFQE